MIKKVLFSSVVLSFLISFTSCMMINDSKEIFADWQSEDQPNICYVDFNGNNTVLFGDNSVELVTADDMDFLSNHRALVKIGDLVYCISRYIKVKEDDSLFGVYKHNFNIVCIDLVTLEKSILYTHYANPLNSNVPYKSSLSGEAKVIYGNRKITFFDGIGAYVFDIATSQVEKIELSEFYSYSAAQFEIDMRSWLIDEFNRPYQTFAITSPNDKRVITIDYMAQRHEYVKQLVDVRHYEGFPESRDLMENFFQSIYVFGDEIYLECMFFDYDGEQNTIFFSYDYATDTFTFLNHFFSSDYPHVYLIPIEE